MIFGLRSYVCLQDGTKSQFLHTTRALRMLRLAKVTRDIIVAPRHKSFRNASNDDSNQLLTSSIPHLFSAPEPPEATSPLSPRQIRGPVGGSHRKFRENLVCLIFFRPTFGIVSCQPP